MTGAAYDLIGDVHGHADKLQALLARMGYLPAGRGYRAPQGRQAVLLGDLIDTGPGQLRVLEIVRAMVESGDALALMGNHEFNAIAYVTDDPFKPGERLRPNLGESRTAVKNRQQHEHFLGQVGEGSVAHRAWVSWFRTLPAWLDLGGLRAAHACWDEQSIAVLSSAGWEPGSALSDELLLKVGRHLPQGEETPLIRARKLLTCGLELPLPEGRAIIDRKGHAHREVRIASWRHWAREFSELALVPAGQEVQLEGMEWPADLVIKAIEGPPVFLGHHWFSGHPRIESPKLACLDWSAARGGPLVAYRWSGEAELTDANLVWA